MDGDADDHAVVIGAGLAGLLSAHVLARRFARVTVVERDSLPESGPAFRPGVPQSRHVHLLWTRGLELIESQLPGITGELSDAGAYLLDAPADLLWLSPVDWFGRMSGVPLLAASRELVEWTIRRAVTRADRIRLRVGVEVVGLRTGPDGRAVRAVLLRGRGGSDHARVERLDAGFVVDATGRTSRAPAWLTQLGYPAPEVTRCDARLAYSSRYYRARSGGGDWKAIYVQARSGRPRAAVLLRVDGGRWLVTLMGNGEHAPPTRDEDFLEFTRGLRSPVLYEVLREAEPLSSATGFRDTANEWRHYERSARWPDGFVVIGDAACRFNPVYGHGMSVAAIAAGALADVTRGMDHRDIPRVAREVQRRVAAGASAAWGIATSGDRRHGGPERPASGPLATVLSRYLPHVLAAANVDPRVARGLFAVLSLTASPGSLFAPATLIRVLAKWRLLTTPATSAYPPGYRSGEPPS